ncbi:MAG: heme exporter protein CcmB [Pontibacterium sp.]
MSEVSNQPKQMTIQSASSLGIFALYSAVLKRELLLSMRRLGEMANPLIFFLVVASLFPLGISPEPAVLAELAPGVVWVAALLATLLSVDGMFRADYDDGTLEQTLVSPQPLFVVVLGKVTAHWLTTGLPLTLMSPLLAIMLFLPEQATLEIVLSLLVGTPTLSFIGAIGAALTVGLRKGDMLISLLVLPLYIPVLIFGTAVVQAAINGVPIDGFLAILGALLVLSVTLTPFAIGAALKISVTG